MRFERSSFFTSYADTPALTNEAASGSSPIALMAKAGHSNMKTTRIYLHLAGTVFPEEAAALERRLFGRRSELVGPEGRRHGDDQ
jgi:hypothetical protein